MLEALINLGEQEFIRQTHQLYLAEVVSRYNRRPGLRLISYDQSLS